MISNCMVPIMLVGMHSSPRDVKAYTDVIILYTTRRQDREIDLKLMVSFTGEGGIHR